MCISADLTGRGRPMTGPLTNAGIYAIITPLGVYVGSTTTPIYKRWHRHKTKLKAGIHKNKHLQRAWNECGEDSFDVRLLEAVPTGELTKEELTALEADWISATADNINICKNGYSPAGVVRTEEYKRKMSESQRNRHQRERLLSERSTLAS